MIEQAAWSPEQIEAYVAKPVAYECKGAGVKDLTLGLSVAHTKWVWKPRADRSPEHQTDYDRLEESLIAYGLKSPVICWEGHVLFGLRRVEIIQRLGLHEYISVINITEDVRRFWKYDIERINRHLKPIAAIDLDTTRGLW